MPTLTVRSSSKVDADREDVWALLADLDGIADWAAPVARSDLEGEPGPGAVRRCTFQDGASIEEKITTWEEGETLEYQVQGDLPVQDAVSTWRLAESGAGVDVTYEMTFTAREDAAEEVEAEMQGTADFLVRALKHRVETGGVLVPDE